MVTPFVPPIYNNNSRTLLGIIHNLGLSTSLNFVLDAADLRSYDGSSQTWTDATGNGFNFFLGADGAATATDPTFVGTAGLLTEATYFSLDGGDYFTETTTHTFADSWHKDNGAFSLVCVTYVPASAGDTYIFSNMGATDGVSFGMSSGEALSCARADSNTTVETETSSALLTTTSWNFAGVGFDEATTAMTLKINGTAETPTVGASTATDNNSQPLRICARGDAAVPLISGSRIACIAGWSTNIGAAALNNIYTRLKSRRFTSLP